MTCAANKIIADIMMRRPLLPILSIRIPRNGLVKADMVYGRVKRAPASMSEKPKRSYSILLATCMKGNIAVYVRTQLMQIIQNDRLNVRMSLHLNLSSSVIILLFTVFPVAFFSD